MPIQKSRRAWLLCRPVHNWIVGQSLFSIGNIIRYSLVALPPLSLPRQLFLKHPHTTARSDTHLRMGTSSAEPYCPWRWMRTWLVPWGCCINASSAAESLVPPSPPTRGCAAAALPGSNAACIDGNCRPHLTQNCIPGSAGEPHALQNLAMSDNMNLSQNLVDAATWR